MITIILGLYGKPNWDMDIEGKTRIKPELLKYQGETIRERLDKVASIVEKLQNHGWKLSEAYGSIYSLDYCNEHIIIEEAEDELRNLGIDLEDVEIVEFNKQFNEELEEFWEQKK